MSEPCRIACECPKDPAQSNPLTVVPFSRREAAEGKAQGGSSAPAQIDSAPAVTSDDDDDVNGESPEGF